MNSISDSVRIEADVAACEECGATSRVGRGLCLNCMLHQALGSDTETTETLQEVLDEIDVRDADWRIGNYQILEEIGRGGMGVIYRARQRHSRRIVALKRILTFHADSRETLARFRREAEAAASLDHPNILPIYEVSESGDGLPFFSMKFAAGGSLLDAAANLRNDPRRIVRLLAKVTRAVQHAHLQGIMHRDLKPGNILLDGRGEPLVSDFGLAKWLDTSSDLTRTLTIFGTPGYIAPEQAHASAKNLTPAADIYSIGAVLFDLFTGRTPFLGEHALAVIKQASDNPAPKLRTLAPLADCDLETICAKCLEREPQARYQTAGELAEDFERWLEGRPIIARPLSPPVRIWRWSKRNPKLAGSLAAIVVLGGAGLAAIITTSHLSSIVQRAEIARHSVAVLPFEDLDELSTTSQQAREATDAFTTGLTKVSAVRASSAERKVDVDPCRPEDWKKIGEGAGTRFVLTGSVRKREGKKRLATHLIESASGSVLRTWLEDVDSFSDVVKASLTKIPYILGYPRPPSTGPTQLSTALDADVSSVGDSNNPTARSYYARGRELFFRYNLADQKRAAESFQKAVEIDPNYARAYAMLAGALRTRHLSDPNGGWLERADAAVATALRLAPMLPEAHRAFAGSLRLKGQLRSAIDSYLTACELDPSDARAAAAIGNIYDFAGRPDLAIVWLERATRRESRPLYADDLGEAWSDLGAYEKAEKEFNIAAEFRPDLAIGALGLSKLALFRGDYESARRRCNAAQAKYKDDPQPLMLGALVEFFSRRFEVAEKLYREASALNRAGGVDFPGSVRFISALGFIQKLSDAHSKEGKALLEEAFRFDERDVAAGPESPTRLYSLAADCAALAKNESAMLALERAIAAGWIDYRSMELDPRFDSIREAEAFKDTLTRLKQKVEEMRQTLARRQLVFN